MKTENTTMIFLSIALVLGSTIARSSILNTSIVFANHEFAANLTGQQEVPPVDTQALGEVIFFPHMPINDTMIFMQMPQRFK